ncbi:MAG: integrin alpha [Phycisphaera sp.]|nr:MAG: integrin alpha [Phycisphaera sp.]
MPHSTIRPVAALALLAVVGHALAQDDPLAEPFPARIDLGTLEPAGGGDGTLGAAAMGLGEFEKLGFSAAIAGDLNGDGLADVVIGALASDGYRRFRVGGEAYVVFGRAGGLPAEIDLDALDGGDGFRVGSADPDRPMGYAVAAAGDVNGDGIDDLVLGDSGAPQYSSSGTGGAVVIFGRDVAGGGSPFPARVVIEDMDGTDGFRITDVCQPISGGTHCAQAGTSIAGVGDINGDGVDDLALGAPDDIGDPPVGGLGAVYVLFGRSGGFPAEVALDALAPGEGFKVLGEDWFNEAGRSVAGAGDINGDGFADVVIGASQANSQQYCYGGYGYCYTVYGGRAYVLFGRDAGDPFPAEIPLAGLDGTEGFALNIDNIDARLGGAVAGAGDLNGDGMDDLALGAPGASHTRYGSYSFPGKDHGRTYVVFGRPASSPFGASVALDELDGADGFVLAGLAVNAMAGQSLGGAGDVTGDGVDDLLIAMPGVSDAFLLLGRDVATMGPFDAQLEPDDLAAVGEGAYFDAPGTGHRLRTGVGGGGDINGDGRVDMVVGAPGVAVSPFDFTGAAYIVYGRGVACAADLDGDGLLTIFDFLAFQNAFDAGDPIADFDGDGELTIFDFLAFQNAFDAGCP